MGTELNMTMIDNTAETLAKLASLDIEELRNLSTRLEDAQQAVKAVLRNKLNRQRQRTLASASA
jgi:hypothetical protein